MDHCRSCDGVLHDNEEKERGICWACYKEREDKVGGNDLKIRPETYHPEREECWPIHIYHPSGRGESFQELTLEQAEALRDKLSEVIARVRRIRGSK